ncbi:hypothetical protein [Sorangium sp. So ce861]|uniref:hypothetical protein n=1 Tax=Sorangium sp. So ce861 TaxID=3133323 RepID=UPI003F5FF06D
MLLKLVEIVLAGSQEREALSVHLARGLLRSERARPGRERVRCESLSRRPYTGTGVPRLLSSFTASCTHSQPSWAWNVTIRPRSPNHSL